MVQAVGTGLRGGVECGGESSRGALNGVFVVTGLGVGGAELMLCRLIARLRGRNFAPSVISLSGGGSLAGAFRDLDIPVCELGWQSGFPRFHQLRQLTTAIRNLRPHLVQGWMLHANVAAEAARRISCESFRVIWNIRHSLDEDSLVGEQGTTPWSTSLALRALRYTSSWPERIVYNSQASVEQHRKIGYDVSRTTVIPNGFDCEAYRPRPHCRSALRSSLGIEGEVPLVGLVARVHPVKDHGNFLRAARILVSRGSKAHFVLVGKGTNLEPMAAQIHALGLDGRVHALGERSDVAELTAAFDLVVCSSKAEAFPNSVGEAMACGVPCVVTDVGDAALLVGATGRVVPCGDSTALGDACWSVLELDPMSRRKLGEAARQRILREFSLDTMVSRYERLYEEVVRA